MAKVLTNSFFDINKFPASPGLILFPISLSKISNRQNAKKCFEYMEHFIIKRKAVAKPLVGLNFIYGDYLYFHSDESASSLRNKFMPLTLAHKNEFMKLLSKNPWYIDKAFHFSVWNQLLLEAKEFINYFGHIKKLYSEDKEFKKWVKKDLESFQKEKQKLKSIDENKLNFLLEEILVFYLIAKGKIKLQNDFVQGHQKWILPCYPGNPLYSEIYLFQLNPFKLKHPHNEYENCYYDLEKHLLYDYSRVDLESLELN